MLIEVGRDRDSTGNLEEFTCGFVSRGSRPIHTMHLNADGLPKIGTEIRPGMILVGKIGKSSTFNPDRQPTPGEANWLNFEEMQAKYGIMAQYIFLCHLRNSRDRDGCLFERRRRIATSCGGFDWRGN